MSEDPDKKLEFSCEVQPAEEEEAVLANTPLQSNAFSSLSAFGFAFAVLNTWVALVVGLGAGLSAGGPSGLLWGFIYAFLGNLSLTVSHSEILAVFPTAGGQYHWSAMLASPRMRASLSWITGILNVISLWLVVSSVGYLSSILVISAVLVQVPDWTVTAGQQFAIFAASVVIAPVLSVVIGTKANRLVDKFLMLFSIASALAIFITLLATSSPKASPSFVFGGTYNGTGYNSMAIAWLLGILQSAFSFVGFDIVYHISEELPNPRKEGPRVVNLAIIVGGVSGIMILLAMLFSINDIEGLLATKYGLPFTQLVYDCTGSTIAASIFVLIPAILLMNSARGVSLTAARVLLSMGRDNILPYSHLFQVVVMGEPIYGLILTLTIALLAGLVQLGSTAAFNSLLGSASVFYEVTYIIPVVIMLVGGRRRLHNYMPERTFNLGRYGILINLFACFFVLETCVIFCFPATIPVDAHTMNYVVVYVGGITACLLAIWFGWARKSFPGPDRSQILAISNRYGVVAAEIADLDVQLPSVLSQVERAS